MIKYIEEKRYGIKKEIQVIRTVRKINQWYNKLELEMFYSKETDVNGKNLVLQIILNNYDLTE